MGQDSQGASLVVFVGHLFQPSLGLRVLAQKEHGGFTEGPLQIGIADLPASGAIGFTGRLFLAFDPEKAKQLT